jgi:hypothetical protein
MAEQTWIEQTVEKAVSQALDSQMPQLRQELVSRVLQEVQPQVNGSANGSSGDFLKAVSSIHSGSTQREILRALLDNTVRYSGRAALFVVKSGAGSGWQGRGLSNPEAIKDFNLDVNAGLAGRAMQSRMPFAGSSAEMEARFISQFGAPADGQAIVLPLLLKDKVAALIYADSGADPGGKLDSAALELLVMSASAWLEVAALRKQAHREGASPESSAPSSAKQESAPAVQSAPSYSDPFAAQAPAHVMEASAMAVEDPVSTQADEGEEAAQAEPAAFAAAASSGGAISSPATAASQGSMSADDAEVHRKAQRFARLLVDEIKLYNQAKVAEGRKNKDLYNRLKDDIDKSQATYEKRYGNTVAASASYFDQELIRSIAEDDPGVMGSDFRR